MKYVIIEIHPIDVVYPSFQYEKRILIEKQGSTSMELSYDSRYSIYSTVLVQSTTKIQDDDDDAQNASNVYVNNDDCLVFVALQCLFVAIIIIIIIIIIIPIILIEHETS